MPPYQPIYQSSRTVPIWLAESPEWHDEFRHFAITARQPGIYVELSKPAIRYATVRCLQRLAKEMLIPTLDIGWVEIAVLTGRLTDVQAGAVVGLAVGSAIHRTEPIPVGVAGLWEERWDGYYCRENIAGSVCVELDSSCWAIHAAGIRSLAVGFEKGVDGKAAADRRCQHVPMETGPSVRVILIETLATEVRTFNEGGTP